MASSPESPAYHLTPAAWYESYPGDQPYLPEAFEREGFIHLTHGIERVIEVGNRYYRGEPGTWLLLEVDLRQVTSDVRYDDAERAYPHIYGPLDRAAIRAVRTMQRDDEGRFTGVARSAGFR
jgi:uncharacterized protein (DUF952 family)